jgi:hypothetical protein
MKIRLFLLLSLLSIPWQLSASGDPQPAGGRGAGLANAAVTLTDQWALFTNAAGIAGNTAIHTLFAYDNRFGVAGMQSLAAGVLYPTRYGNWGACISRLGDALYSESLAGLAYGHQISNVRLGLKVNYLQVHISDLGTRGNLVMEFGGIADILPQLSFGAHVYNFNQARLADYQDERIPTVMKAGLAYKPFSKLMLVLETEKDVDFPARVKAGLEYEIVKNFRLRTGIGTRPFTNHFGFGLSPKNLSFDYAFRTHPALGYSHHLSLAYRIEKRTGNTGDRRKGGRKPADG